MTRFILRRLFVTIPMIFVVVSLTWGLIRLAPGNFYTGERVSEDIDAAFSRVRTVPPMRPKR